MSFRFVPPEQVLRVRPPLVGREPVLRQAALERLGTPWLERQAQQALLRRLPGSRALESLPPVLRFPGLQVQEWLRVPSPLA